MRPHHKKTVKQQYTQVSAYELLGVMSATKVIPKFAPRILIDTLEAPDASSVPHFAPSLIYGKLSYAYA